MIKFILDNNNKYSFKQISETRIFEIYITKNYFIESIHGNYYFHAQPNNVYKYYCFRSKINHNIIIFCSTGFGFYLNIREAKKVCGYVSNKSYNDIIELIKNDVSIITIDKPIPK